MPKNPSVLIIILNWNGLEDTLACLDSLKKVTYQNFKTLVIDNGSKNNEADKIKGKYGDFTELIENQENTGFTGGNNQGFEIAKKHNYDYVLMLNNDTIVEPYFLTKIVNAAESDESIGITGPTINYHDEPEKIWYGGGIFHWWTGLGLHKDINKVDYKRDQTPRPTGYMTGCAMLIKKEVLEKIGGLDKDYFAYYEDLDFCIRAKQAGFKIMYVPDSKIYHKVSSSLGFESPRYITQITKNRFIFMKKNFGGLKYFIFKIIFWLYKVPLKALKKNQETLKAYKEGARLGASWKPQI